MSIYNAVIVSDAEREKLDPQKGLNTRPSQYWSDTNNVAATLLTSTDSATPQPQDLGVHKTNSTDFVISKRRSQT